MAFTYLVSLPKGKRLIRIAVILFDQVPYQDLFAEPEGFEEPKLSSQPNQMPKPSSSALNL